MSGPHRRRMVPRRRRRDDEGEDESLVAGDLEDFSLSEGSAVSNADDDADIEGSEISADDEDAKIYVAGAKLASYGADDQTAVAPTSKGGPGHDDMVHPGTRALANGLEREESETNGGSPQVHEEEVFNGAVGRANPSALQSPHPPETLAERARREHQEYIRQRNSNPAFVPNRGGFFLHDDRSATQSSLYGRPYPRGRGRGYNPGLGIGRGYGQSISGPTDRPWAHDLHDTINKSAASPLVKDAPNNFTIPTAKPAAVAPNRTFSVSTVLGNVTIQVFLPGMGTKKIFQNLVKKQHTLLPQHRPPLRRDKPVRISIPDEDPRYIFPSTERSFIFIPRAMRPNQQMYVRGRGRGSYQGSRRASIMGSTYTPSISMSRRSSLGGAGSTGIHTPTDGTIPRGPMIPNFNRPVVRMPVAPMTVPGIMPPPISMVPIHATTVPSDHATSGPTILHSPTVTLPMHQPRPQKTVSVAEIESPTVKAPQQQQEQPFHQQMPPGVTLADGPVPQQGQTQPNLVMGTPLSHIPEGAVYAQPFQPYPVYPQGGYYGPAFPGGPMVYHAPADPYGMGVGGPIFASHYPPGQHFVPGQQQNETGAQPGAMAHETNGMVYYYDPSQYPADGSHMSQYPMPAGGGMMGVPGAGPYFYSGMPSGMYYPAAQ